MAAGRPKLELAKMGVIGVVTFIAFFVGVSWGLGGVAWGRMAVSIVSLPVGMFGIRRVVNLDVKAYWKVCSTPIPACAVMVGVVWFVDHTFAPQSGSLLWLFILGLLGLVVYVGALTLTARATVNELVLLVRTRGAG
jgi:peptidoglycan biosynthesis protein MviN/MurJ (putative lipid II flippase)